MNEQLKEQIVVALEAYRDSKEISNSKLAGYLKINTSYLTYIFQRKWNEVPAGRKTVKLQDSYFNGIAKKIGFKIAKSYWQHFDTYNYLEVMNTLNEASNMKKCRLIDGNTGSGKTYSIGEYVKQNPTETYVVTCADYMSAKDFIASLAEKLVVATQGSRAAMMRAICAKLTDLIRTGHSPVIIIDEAENMRDGSYGAIKALCDLLKDQCGIVLVGANNYADKIKKKASKGKACFPQIYSRFKGGIRTLFTLAHEDVSDICEGLGIKQVRIINFLADISEDFRDLTDYVTTILQESEKSGEPLTLEFCKKVLGK